MVDHATVDPDHSPLLNRVLGLAIIPVDLEPCAVLHEDLALLQLTLEGLANPRRGVGGQPCRGGELIEGDCRLALDVEELLDLLGEFAQRAVQVIRAGVGAINESDVDLAVASNAIVVGFNVRPERSATALAEQEKVDIRLHTIIYELIDEVKLAMTGLLEPVFKETVQGHAEVREIFKISKVGTVAGCYVSDGVIRRDSRLRVMRDGEVIHTGRIESLKRFKNDANEVKSGLECGISFTNFNSAQIGDTLEAFTMERIAPEMPAATLQ